MEFGHTCGIDRYKRQVDRTLLFEYISGIVRVEIAFKFKLSDKDIGINIDAIMNGLVFQLFISELICYMCDALCKCVNVSFFILASLIVLFVKKR